VELQLSRLPKGEEEARRTSVPVGGFAFGLVIDDQF
jgi:hypothetical protein